MELLKRDIRNDEVQEIVHYKRDENNDESLFFWDGKLYYSSGIIISEDHEEELRNNSNYSGSYEAIFWYEYYISNDVKNSDSNIDFQKLRLFFSRYKYVLK